MSPGRKLKSGGIIDVGVTATTVGALRITLRGSLKTGRRIGELTRSRELVHYFEPDLLNQLGPLKVNLVQDQFAHVGFHSFCLQITC